MDRKESEQYTTDLIYESAVAGKDMPDEVMYDPADAKKEKEAIRMDIYKFIDEHPDRCKSENTFRQTFTSIEKSQFSRFMNGDDQKGLGRDSLLQILITLGYPLPKIRTTLHRLGLPDLYARNRRDYFIIQGIAKGMSLDELNVRLNDEGYDPLWTKEKETKK